MYGRLILGAVSLVTASAASAQWIPGMEIYGQDVQVQTNGVLNTVHFSNDGTARISSPAGSTIVDAQWTASGGKLCVTTSSTADCYPYARPFTAQLPVDLQSDCGVLSRWTALATAVMPGERG